MSTSGLPKVTARVANAAIRMIRIAAGPSVQRGEAPTSGWAANAPPPDRMLGAGAFGEDGETVVADFGEAARNADALGRRAGGLVDLQFAVLQHRHDGRMAGHRAELAF